VADGGGGALWCPTFSRALKIRQVTVTRSSKSKRRHSGGGGAPVISTHHTITACDLSICFFFLSHLSTPQYIPPLSQFPIRFFDSNPQLRKPADIMDRIKEVSRPVFELDPCLQPHHAGHPSSCVKMHADTSPTHPSQTLRALCPIFNHTAQSHSLWGSAS